jgi:two-component system phosphate regulon sensor histidine kinase PhoR
MTEGVTVTDTDGRILLVNPAARRLLGLGNRTRVGGRSLLEIYPSPLLSEALEEAMQRGKAINKEMVLRRQKTLYLAVAVAPVRQEGITRGAVAVLHDISKIRQLERIRRDFVANVSHELRTPLATISGYAETLMTGPFDLDPTAQDFVETIERHGRRLTAMVQDLLMLARIEAEGSENTLGQLRLQAVVAEVLDAVGREAKNAGVRVSVELGDVPPVRADQRALHQVLRNLVSNAIKYSEPGDEVRLLGSVDADRGQVSLSVVDQGIGIAPVHLPRIFERFYRVDEGRSRDAGGTGLGLAIVKHMVQNMDAQIAVESTPGEGSTFILTFNAALDPDELRATFEDEDSGEFDTLDAG